MAKFDELIAKLKEIFQIDKPELDFGIYRIINARASEIDDYLKNKLRANVEKALIAGDAGNKAHLEQALQDAIKNAEALGVPSDNVPKVQELKKQLSQFTGASIDYENQVYSHLLKFFSRYYEKGDFISKRRYKGDTYAVPYSGEEVVLHWANKDQYYTKSGENFSNYTFILDDERKVHFKLVSADVAKDNRKDNDKERCFVLTTERIVENEEGEEQNIVPVYEENGELVINFEYKPMPKGTKQKELLEAAIEQIFAESIISREWSALAERSPTEANPERTLLEKQLSTYVSKNNADYFIHKDLDGFLRRELDFYIKNEVMNLDDVQNITVFNEIEKKLKMIQCLRTVAQDLITFLAQLENFQKKLWLKKKFVTETNYCITLDRVPEEFYEQIASNDAQREEWIRLFAIDEIKASKGGIVSGGSFVNAKGQMDITKKRIPLRKFAYSEPLEVGFLKENRYMLLDTKFFDEQFKTKLLASIDNFDEQCDGLLVNSENFQALNILQERYREQVKCIYIDPPYNTELDREQGNFIYKDGYAFSTWACFILDRLLTGSKLLESSGTLFTSIDDNEAAMLRLILDDIFGIKNYISTISWKSRDSVSSDHKISMNHNYHFVYSKNEINNQFGGYLLDANDYSNPDKDPRGPWKPVPLDANKPGGDTQYGITNPYTGEIYYPPNKRSWAINQEKYTELFDDNRISFGTKGNSSPKKKLFYKERLEKGDRKTPISIWTDTETTKNGTTQLMSLFADKSFSYPKPVGLIKRIIQISHILDDLTVLDYFAGSGTTGHAVINLNREEDGKGKRKYILIEMGDYFDTVLKPRIQKVVYSKEWKGGKPKEIASIKGKHIIKESKKILKSKSGEALDLFELNNDYQGTIVEDNLDRDQHNPFSGVSHCFKYLKLESYEDTLNNLKLQRTVDQADLLSNFPEGVKEEYLLKYMLDIESRGSLLSTDAFLKPFDYYLDIAIDSAGASRPKKVDLVETFNYLIGLRVKHSDIDYDKGLALIEGELPSGEQTLVIWRDCEKISYDELNKYCERHDITPKDSEYDVIYINGDHNIPNQTEDNGITRTLKLRQIEDEFLTRMFETEDV
jgi:adenine-specific DNA-methyltransferase